LQKIHAHFLDKVDSVISVDKMVLFL